MTDPRHAAAPGWTTEGGAENRTADTPRIPPEDVPPLATMTPRARAIALAYFESGRVEGIAAGRRERDAEIEAEWAALTAEVLPRLRSLVPYAELAERRGEHDRAELQRRTLRDRGVA